MRGQLRLAAAVALAACVVLFAGLPGVRAETVAELKALNAQATALASNGKLAEALLLVEKFEVLTKKQYSNDSVQHGLALNNLAQIYEKICRTTEAEHALKRALYIDEKAPETNHPHISAKLSNLAHLYQSLGRYAEAEPLMLRSLDVDQKSPNPSQPDLTRDFNNLASLYQAEGRYREAEPLMDQALAMVESHLAADDPQVGIYINNLAGLYLEQGRCAEAEQLFRREPRPLCREPAAGARHAPGVRDRPAPAG